MRGPGECSARLSQGESNRHPGGTNRREDAADQPDRRRPGDRRGEQVRGDPEGEGDLAEGLPIDRRRAEPVEGDIGEAPPAMPPPRAITSDSSRIETITAPAPNPSARNVAISLTRAETAPYMVLRAPNRAPSAIRIATKKPIPRMKAVIAVDCAA